MHYKVVSLTKLCLISSFFFLLIMGSLYLIGLSNIYSIQKLRQIHLIFHELCDSLFFNIKQLIHKFFTLFFVLFLKKFLHKADHRLIPNKWGFLGFLGFDVFHKYLLITNFVLTFKRL